MQKLCPLSFALFFFNHKKIDAYKNINYVYLHTFYIFYADFMKGYKIRRVYPDGLSFLKKTNHGNFSLWFCVAHFEDRTIKSKQYWEIFNRFHNTLLIAGKIYNTPTLFTFFYFNVFLRNVIFHLFKSISLWMLCTICIWN